MYMEIGILIGLILTIVILLFLNDRQRSMFRFSGLTRFFDTKQFRLTPLFLRVTDIIRREYR